MSGSYKIIPLAIHRMNSESFGNRIISRKHEVTWPSSRATLHHWIIFVGFLEGKSVYANNSIEN